MSSNELKYSRVRWWGYFVLSRLEQPRQDKNLLYRHEEPNEPTKRISFICILESLFASVSTVSRGHPSTLYSLSGPILRASPQRSHRLEDRPWSSSWPACLEERGMGRLRDLIFGGGCKGNAVLPGLSKAAQLRTTSIINSSCGDVVFVLNHPLSLN